MRTQCHTVISNLAINAICTYVVTRVLARTMRPPYSPGNKKVSLKNTLLEFTDPPIPQAMPFRLIGIFMFRLEQFFLTPDFSIFFVIIFFYFLSHRLSALRKRRKQLIFTPNISTGDGGVHRHQAIVSFLLYNTTTNHYAFNFTSLNDAILQLPRFSAYKLCAGIL